MVVLKDGDPIVVSDSEYLMHYGIPGMKWGVRRYQNKDGTLTAAGKRRERAERKAEAREEREARKSEEQKHSERQKKLDVKNRGALSNQELQEKIQRLRLEKELRTLTDEEVSPGRAMLRKAIESSGQQLMNNAVLGLAKYSLGSVADKVGGKGGELLKAMITGNIPTQKSSLDKLKDEVSRLTLQKRYDELTGKNKAGENGSSSSSEASSTTRDSDTQDKGKTSSAASSANNSSRSNNTSGRTNNTGSAPYSNANNRSGSNRRSTVDATDADYEIFGRGSSSGSSSSTSSKPKKQKVYNVKDWRIVDDEPAPYRPTSSSSNTALNGIQERLALPAPSKKKKK